MSFLIASTGIPFHIADEERWSEFLSPGYSIPAQPEPIAQREFGKRSLDTKDRKIKSRKTISENSIENNVERIRREEKLKKR